MNIHIFWFGPFSLLKTQDLRDENQHYGIYQIYGHHPMYGSHVLLYIGKADQQTFGVRISQEDWEFTYDPGHIEIYIGQLAGRKKITDTQWSELIDLCERLLVYAHNPIYNRSGIYTIPESKLEKLHIHNWNSFRDLFPEISGQRYSSKFDNISEDDIYSYSSGNVIL